MNQDKIKGIQKRTQGMPVVSGRSNKWGRFSFDELVFVPAQLNKKPVDYFREEISAKTIVGKQSKKPFELQTPIVVAAMSFGALSKEAKIALAKASSLAGTAANTGEGGMLPEERESAERLIIQYSTGRFGITEEVLKKADAVEIKIGQGAKGGQGGLLPKEKVTEDIARVRNVEMGKDVHSPPYHPDINNIEDLKQRVIWIRELTGGAPIILKLAAGDLDSDLPLAVSADPDIIAIDGTEGGTGAAPEVMLNEVGVPTLIALAKAKEILNKLGARQELWIGGGLSNGGEIAKALALGADAIFMGTALLVAMGCTYCRLCYMGKCPRGIATQEAELRKNFNVEDSAQKAANFIKNCTEEIKMAAGACGEKNIHNLNKGHLRSLNPDVSKITETKFI